MEKKKVKCKNASKKQKQIFLICIVLIFVVTISIILAEFSKKIQMEEQELIKSLEGKKLVEYVTKSETSKEDFYDVLVTINAEEGLEKVTYTNTITNNEVEINCLNKYTVAFDLVLEDFTDFTVKVKKKGQNETTETRYYEAPRIQGNYTLKERYLCL